MCMQINVSDIKPLGLHTVLFWIDENEVQTKYEAKTVVDWKIS